MIPAGQSHRYKLLKPVAAFSSPALGTSLPPLKIVGVAVLVALASLAMLPVWAAAWHTWSSDPLRSIGAFFPLLALMGVLAAWRRLHWQAAGTDWGAPLVLAAMLAASLFSAGHLLLFLFGERVRILHPGMALFAFGAGCTLWFGGTRLFRLALPPLCLLLLIDPVPHAFNRLLDLPLQHLSANTARAFAHLIGLQPTGEQLQMMFAPDFGMFIVPGCNGIRGAVTFGYLALIFGYIRRLPPKVLAVGTVAAVLVGYLFNLLRLCTLVLYYRTGVAVPAIRPYGTQVDYVIGVTLFLLATLGVGVAITWYQMRHPRPWPVEPVAGGSHKRILPRAIMLAVVAFGLFIPQARSVAASFRPPLEAADVIASFPQTVGPFVLTHTWEEREATGSLMFVFGDYRNQVTGQHLAFSVYLASEDHYVFLSKLAQGIRPDFQSSFDTRTADGPAHLITSFYRTADVLTEDAETSCRADLCDESLELRPDSVGFVKPHLADLLVAPATRQVPILLRRQWVATSPEPDAVLRAQFEASAREFLAGLDLRPLLAKAN